MNPSTPPPGAQQSYPDGKMPWMPVAWLLSQISALRLGTSTTGLFAVHMCQHKAPCHPLWLSRAVNHIDRSWKPGLHLSWGPMYVSRKIIDHLSLERLQAATLGSDIRGCMSGVSWTGDFGIDID